jgi:hypothetical protein
VTQQQEEAGMFDGVRIIESVPMVDRVEDWSRVRSPAVRSRAGGTTLYRHLDEIATCVAVWLNVDVPHDAPGRPQGDPRGAPPRGAL